MITILKNDILEFDHIVHMADIHVKLTQRHVEYKEVFNELYKEIEKTPNNTLIVIAGDLFHTKLELSPEGLQLASDFLTQLANIRPLVVLAGNHDCNCKNTDRLDSITPIIDALNNPNIYYLRNTGLYAIGNILFNVMSVFDLPDKYIKGVDIPAIYRNKYKHIIALYHGVVDGCITENGQVLNNLIINKGFFDNHDIVLMGDIHLLQNIQEYDPTESKPIIHYPSSLIQQNFGEPLFGHGISYWTLNTRSYEHIEIHNQYGFYNIEIHDGILTTKLDKLPKKCSLKVHCFNSLPTDVKKIIAEVKTLTEVISTSYVRIDSKNVIHNKVSSVDLKNINNLQYQNKLIENYLKNKLNIVNQKDIDYILELNTNYNNTIKKSDIIKNLNWKPIKLEWDNMFVFGEENVLNFEKMTGIYGIFGPNKVGKSSILDILIFCLFDKASRCFKGNHILNIQKSTFFCKLEFEIDGVRYFIQRNGMLGPSGAVKVDVEFWRIVNGEKEYLNGTERKNTNAVIREYVGSYDDFILTTSSFQSGKNNISFIEIDQSDRKDLLVKLIGLDIFDKLHEAANEKFKDMSSLLKIHKNINLYDALKTNTEELERIKLLLDSLNSSVAEYKYQLTTKNENIINESSKLSTLDNISFNITSLKKDQEKIQNEIYSIDTSIQQTNTSILNKEMELKTLNVSLEKITGSKFQESNDLYKKYTYELSELKQTMNIKKAEIKIKLHKVEQLKTHKYDPNCKFCVDNDFVKDALLAKQELIIDKKNTDDLLNKYNDLNTKVDSLKWVEQTLKEYSLLTTTHNKITTELTKLKTTLQAYQTLHIQKTKLLETITTNITTYYKNEEIIQKNNVIKENVSNLKIEYNRLEHLYNTNNKQLNELLRKFDAIQVTVTQLNKNIQEMEILEKNCILTKAYLTCLGRDGIAYQIICETLPILEKETNLILTQLADHTIEIDTDGKNIIPMISYDARGKYPIELASGYEKFVTGLAFRTALNNISNLPKCNFIIIDEGFGTLDAENLSKIPILFSYLKTMFDFTIIISHLDILKDMVDKSINVNFDGINSKLTFN